MRSSIAMLFAATLGLCMAVSAGLYAAPASDQAPLVLAEKAPARVVSVETPPDPTIDPFGFFTGLVEVVRTGLPLVIAGFLLYGLVMGIRAGVKRGNAAWLWGFVGWLRTDRGGVFLNFALAFLLEVATRMMIVNPGTPPGFMAGLIGAMSSAFKLVLSRLFNPPDLRAARAA